jgi:glycyl-tRNA synthetase
MARAAFDLEAVIRRRGFIWRSFEIYGGTAGLYDYGPLGTALRNNIISVWRRHFVHQEGFAEIDTPNLTPHEVFLASGHLEKFNDLMLECPSCRAVFKADGFFEEFYPDIAHEIVVDAMTPDELSEFVTERGILCSTCENPFKPAYEFNLMFRTNLGREKTAYLHPETAQGIFVNFQNLYSYHREKLPFGAVQVGKGFRNEISPRQGVIRMREFNMAEAEVFVDPEVNGYPGFEAIRDTEFVLLDQFGAFHSLTAGEAVDESIICHKALAYFMTRTQEFLLEIGIDPTRLRFRQHQKDEMAHYAEDCWDAEIQMIINERESWIECVGIANRSCFDLEQHMEATGQDLRAFRLFDEPVEQEVERVKPNLPLIGRTFRQNAGAVKEYLGSLELPLPDTIEITIDGIVQPIPPEMYSIEKTLEKVSGVRFVPGVIEPSFGVDRIFYAVLQHSYGVGKQREGADDDAYNLLRLVPGIAPVKAAIFPLFNRDGMIDLARTLTQDLIDGGIATAYDDSGSIGKRYARMDEIGTPYCITIDHQSIEDGTATIRDRDTTGQARIGIDEVSVFVRDLLSGVRSFPDLTPL